eukprot:9323857-Heterocapsa_arctica.AAC.3
MAKPTIHMQTRRIYKPRNTDWQSQGVQYNGQEQSKYDEAKKTDVHSEKIDKLRNTDRHTQGVQYNGQEQKKDGATKKTDARPENTDKTRKGDYEAHKDK